MILQIFLANVKPAFFLCLERFLPIYHNDVKKLLKFLVRVAEYWQLKAFQLAVFIFTCFPANSKPNEKDTNSNEKDTQELTILPQYFPRRITYVLLHCFSK